MKKIAVIGSGTMGNGIAHTFAQYGFDVSLADINADALTRAMQTIAVNLDKQIKKGVINEQEKVAALNRIKTYSNLKEAVQAAGLVIEAATENQMVKLDLFEQLSEICPENTILASNTSSIAITEIASVTKRPGNVIGMHFMNPVPLMKLVEVIRGKETTDSTTQTIMELSIQLDKVPVEVNDAPGFVANRILMPMMGPLQLADFIGLDVCLAIIKVLHDGFDSEKYAPCPLLINMVTEGNLGIKSGSGFYKYTAGSKELIVSDRFKKNGF